MEPSLLLLRLPDEVAELFGELSQRSLPAQQRVIVRLPLVLPPASRERARWRQHLSCPRDIGRREARSPPEPLRHVEVRDDADVPEKMLHQLGPRTADEPIRPRDLGILGGRLSMIAGGDRLERHEGGRSGSLPFEIGEGFARVLEALYDHPLEAISEHSFHGRLQTGRHVQEIGHCPDHARHLRGGVGREERSHTRAVAFALALQPVERLAGRFLGGDRDAQAGQRLLGLGAERFLSCQLLLHLFALAGEQRELDARLLEARLEATPGRGQSIGFGAGRGGFTFEAFASAIELRYPLAKLARIARQLGAITGGPDLLEAQGLDGRATLRQLGPACFEVRIEASYLFVQGGETLARLGEGADGLLALDAEFGAPVAQRADLLPQAEILLAELADLRAHLLAALQQPLHLALELLRGLPQVGQPILALLDGCARGGLTGGQLGDHHAPLVLLAAETRALLEESLVGGGEPRVVCGQHGEVQLLAFLMERFVLLGLARLTLEGADLTLHLVHHVAHALEVLPGRLELALRLAALLLVARHPGRFLDEDASLPRLGGQDVVEAVLVHEGIGLGIDAGAREEILHVAEPADALVEEVLALPRAVEAPRDANLAPRHLEAAVVVEDEPDLGQSNRLARSRAMEDDVFHLLSAERLGALLTEGPTDRIGDVRLAATVGTHDARDAGEDLHLGLFCERLEALDDDLFEAHRVAGRRRVYGYHEGEESPRKNPHRRGSVRPQRTR